MKEIYMKALLAVRTLQEQKAAGVDVDEAMLKKAISAVAQTRKVLQSVSLDDSSEGFASFGAKSEHIRHTTEVKRS
jgi:chemotaxis methyl-accepting protein methylase